MKGSVSMSFIEKFGVYVENIIEDTNEDMDNLGGLMKFKIVRRIREWLETHEEIVFAGLIATVLIIYIALP